MVEEATKCWRYIVLGLLTNHQICINQQDILERRFQVQLIREFYEEASKVPNLAQRSRRKEETRTWDYEDIASIHARP